MYMYSDLLPSMWSLFNKKDFKKGEEVHVPVLHQKVHFIQLKNKNVTTKFSPVCIMLRLKYGKTVILLTLKYGKTPSFSRMQKTHYPRQNAY
jgi:hypothetical protein